MVDLKKRKSFRKSVRESTRKSKRKSIRKSRRKNIRKSRRNSIRKSKRKSIRKSGRNSIRKSKRKNIRKSKRKNIHRSKRKNIRRSKRKNILIGGATILPHPQTYVTKNNDKVVVLKVGDDVLGYYPPGHEIEVTEIAQDRKWLWTSTPSYPTKEDALNKTNIRKSKPGWVRSISVEPKESPDQDGASLQDDPVAGGSGQLARTESGTSALQAGSVAGGAGGSVDGAMLSGATVDEIGSQRELDPSDIWKCPPPHGWTLYFSKKEIPINGSKKIKKNSPFFYNEMDHQVVFEVDGLLALSARTSAGLSWDAASLEIDRFGERGLNGVVGGVTWTGSRPVILPFDDNETHYSRLEAPLQGSATGTTSIKLHGVPWGDSPEIRTVEIETEEGSTIAEKLNSITTKKVYRISQAWGKGWMGNLKVWCKYESDSGPFGLGEWFALPSSVTLSDSEPAHSDLPTPNVSISLGDSSGRLSRTLSGTLSNRLSNSPGEYPGDFQDDLQDDLQSVSAESKGQSALPEATIEIYMETEGGQPRLIPLKSIYGPKEKPWSPWTPEYKLLRIRPHRLEFYLGYPSGERTRGSFPAVKLEGDLVIKSSSKKNELTYNVVLDMEEGEKSIQFVYHPPRQPDNGARAENIMGDILCAIQDSTGVHLPLHVDVSITKMRYNDLAQYLKHLSYINAGIRYNHCLNLMAKHLLRHFMYQSSGGYYAFKGGGIDGISSFRPVINSFIELTGSDEAWRTIVAINQAIEASSDADPTGDTLGGATLLNAARSRQSQQEPQRQQAQRQQAQQEEQQKEADKAAAEAYIEKCVANGLSKKWISLISEHKPQLLSSIDAIKKTTAEDINEIATKGGLSEVKSGTMEHILGILSGTPPVVQQDVGGGARSEVGGSNSND